MGTDVINAPELAALVKPVRALLKQNKKIEAIKLVRERTAYGLKESKEFVDHLQLLPCEGDQSCRTVDKCKRRPSDRRHAGPQGGAGRNLEWGCSEGGQRHGHVDF